MRNMCIHHHKTVRIILYLSFQAIVFLTSCREATYRELARIEQTMETDPAKADSLLSVIPEPAKASRRALYAILKTQLDYKNYRPVSDLDLIIDATDYYGIRKKDYHAAMAWYSLGCAYSDSNNDMAAINAYLKAKDLFPDTLTRYYALTEQNLGKHYLNRMMLPEATEQYRLCLANATRMNNEKAMNNAIYNLGRCALYKRDFIVADSIFNNILTESRYSNDQKNLAVFQLSKIRLHHDKDYQQAMKLINEYLSYRKNPEDSGAGLSLKANIYYEIGQIDSAYHYYNKSLDYTQDLNTLCTNYDKLALIALQLGHKDEATQYYNHYKSTADSIYERRNHEQINVIESEHRIELAENRLHDRTIRSAIITASLILLSILLAIIAVIYYRNWKKERIWNIRDTIDQTESDILNKKLADPDMDSIQEEIRDTDDVRIEIMELYQKELQDCSQWFKLQEAYSLISSKTTIRNTELSNDEKIQIIKALNNCFRPVMQFLSEEIPEVSRDEAYVLILLYLGFNSVEISMLLDVTDGCIRQRRKRVQDKDTHNVTQLFLADKV
ncbi:MAG: hypothetical protein IK006_08270 [Bacteroidaceae bacterium]|nr:hypothetical protein [Bacteroidaceae bacterium]